MTHRSPRHTSRADNVIVLERPQRTPLGTLCVFCGARSGNDMRLVGAAAALGAAIASAGIRLVYGGGSDGLMGAVALAAASRGGEVVAIVPDILAAATRPLPAAHRTIRVADMHARKAMMYAMADAFVALPGGIGTLEEVCEIITWRKLGSHGKPILLANFHGFWEPLLDLLDHLQEAGFADRHLRDQVLLAEAPHRVLPLLQRATYFQDDAAAQRGETESRDTGPHRAPGTLATMTSPPSCAGQPTSIGLASLSAAGN